MGRGGFLRELLGIVIGFAALMLVLQNGLPGNLGKSMASGVRFGPVEVTPPAGSIWTAADGQACHAAFSAVADWPGKADATALAAVMYNGSSDVKSAVQRPRTPRGSI